MTDRIALDDRAAYRALVQKTTLETLRSIGEICRLRCSDDPDLLDAISSGIYEFLCDGDVFDQIMVTLFEKDPIYFGRIVARMDEVQARHMIAQVLGSDENEDFVLLDARDSAELNARFNKALAEGTGPFSFKPQEHGKRK